MRFNPAIIFFLSIILVTYPLSSVYAQDFLEKNPQSNESKSFWATVGSYVTIENIFKFGGIALTGGGSGLVEMAKNGVTGFAKGKAVEVAVETITESVPGAGELKRNTNELLKQSLFGNNTTPDQIAPTRLPQSNGQEGPSLLLSNQLENTDTIADNNTKSPTVGDLIEFGYKAATEGVAPTIRSVAIGRATDFAQETFLGSIHGAKELKDEVQRRYKEPLIKFNSDNQSMYYADTNATQLVASDTPFLRLKMSNEFEQIPTSGNDSTYINTESQPQTGLFSPGSQNSNVLESPEQLWSSFRANNTYYPNLYRRDSEQISPQIQPTQIFQTKTSRIDDWSLPIPTKTTDTTYWPYSANFQPNNPDDFYYQIPFGAQQDTPVLDSTDVPSTYCTDDGCAF